MDFVSGLWPSTLFLPRQLRSGSESAATMVRVGIENVAAMVRVGIENAAR
jgi:hypothetical protein